MKSYFLITGASGGFGRAFSVALARKNFNLFLTDQDAGKLRLLADALMRTYGINVKYQPCNLLEQSFRDELFSEIRKKGYLFRGLVNIAGGDAEGFFLESGPLNIRDVLRLNIEAAVDITYFALTRRNPNITFRIINISSLAAYFPMPRKAVYSSSKRFMLNFSLALREELRNENATVTALCPSGIPTTPYRVKTINSQGLFGQLSVQQIGRVVTRTLDLAERNRAVYIPGFFNKLFMGLGALIPKPLLTRLLIRRWRRTSKKVERMESA